MSLYNVLL